MEDPSVQKFVRLLKQQRPLPEATTTEQQLERIKHYYVVKRHQKTVLGYAAFLSSALLLLVAFLYLKAWCPHMACAVFLPARIIVMYFDEVDKTRASLGNHGNFEPYVAFKSPLIAALSCLALVEFALVFVASLGFPLL